MTSPKLAALLAGAAALAGVGAIVPTGRAPATAAETGAAACPGDNAGLSLPPGFCATVFAEDVGHARQMTVGPDGTLYVNTWSGGYYSDDKPRAGGFLTALRDSNGDGIADYTQRFGPGLAQGSHGGTGIALRDDWLYVEINDSIVRYRMAPGQPIPTAEAETIVSGLPTTGEHPMHQFVIDKAGALFVNVGSATNACEIKMNIPSPKVLDPCTETRTRAGIWKFDADKTGQTFSAAARYATGIRNIGGMRIDEAGRLYVTQHGRDALSQNWAKLYRPDQGPELPAEELIEVKARRDYGWPTCYYDGFQKKMVLAPEYGGDGGRKVGICAGKEPPVAHFPAHWAPNDLLLYRGAMFPAAWRDGVFIAFHGSWNRAPQPQAGFRIVFQPMAGGKASGDFLTFADGFPGKARPGHDAYRPSGLATATDGALYVSDDNRGRIYRITYRGPATAARAAAPAPVYAAAAASGDALPTPPGATAEQVALGRRIFHGEAAGGTCSGCHGSEGAGGGMGSTLNKGQWLTSDGSLAGIAKVVREGVPEPKEHAVPMPALGGAQLSDADVAAVSAYVWAIGHRGS